MAGLAVLVDHRGQCGAVRRGGGGKRQTHLALCLYTQAHRQRAHGVQARVQQHRFGGGWQWRRRARGDVLELRTHLADALVSAPPQGPVGLHAQRLHRHVRVHQEVRHAQANFRTLAWLPFEHQRL